MAEIELQNLTKFFLLLLLIIHIYQYSHIKKKELHKLSTFFKLMLVVKAES